MKNIFFFMLMLSIIVVSGCLDPIDLEVPAKERETLIIQGKLGKGDPSVVEVAVNRLFDFTPSSRLPVTVRSIVLLDDEGNSKELETTSISTYKAVIPNNDPDISIDFGKSYQIRVSTFDNRVFISDLEPLLPVPTPDELIFDTGTTVEDSTGQDVEVLNVYISSDLAPQGASNKSKMRWDVEMAYQATDAPTDGTEPKTCWITTLADLSKIKTVDGDDLSGDRIERFLIAELSVGPRFAEGVYINVYQESLNASSLKYWEEVGELVDRTGNMFEAPVGKLSTNIRNANEGVKDEVFGYFYATTRDVIRVFVDPSDVGSPTPTCPWTGMAAPGRGCTIPQICCDCSALQGSSTQKPSYWVR